MEGQRGFGALVFVEIGLAEAVAAASGREVVERAVQPISPQEPVERGACTRSVLPVPRRDERSELGLDERRRVERLLVALAGCGLVAVASTMAWQAQPAFVEAALVAQPGERLEPERDVGGAPECRAPDDERLWEPRVVVGEPVLEPQPRSSCCVLVGGRELFDEPFEEHSRVVVETIGIEAREAENRVGGRAEGDIVAHGWYECVEKRPSGA